MSNLQTEKVQETCIAGQRDRLRLLARIIARAYSYDAQKQGKTELAATIVKRIIKQPAQVPSKSQESAKGH